MSQQGLSTARKAGKPPGSREALCSSGCPSPEPTAHPSCSKLLPASGRHWVRFAQGPASATVAAKRVLW